MYRKRIQAFALLAALSVGVLAGCAPKPDATSQPGATQSSAATTGQTPAPGGDKAAEPVTLRIMGKDKSAVLANEKATLSQWATGDSKMWEKFSGDLAARGVKLDLDFVAEDQYDTVIQTQLAAGMDCDIVNLSPLDNKTRLRLVEQKRIVSVSDIIDQYSDGTAKTFYRSGPGAFAFGLTALEDGKVYWLTDVQTTYYKDPSKVVGSAMGFMIRKDWLDKLGLAVPTTTQQLTEALKAFQDQDVNGSGEKDEVIAVPIKSFGTGIGQWFGFGPGLTYADDLDGGKIKSPWYSEHVKDYIAYMKGLVDAGLVDTSDQQSVKEPENKIAGLFNWALETWEEPTVKVPEGAAAPYYLPFLATAVEGKEPLGIIQRGNQISNRGYAVTSECKHPEAVAALLDTIATPEFDNLTEYGIEGYTYNVAADGTKERIKQGPAEVQVMASFPALWTNDSILPRLTMDKDVNAEMLECIEDGKSAGYPETGYQAKYDFCDRIFNATAVTGHDPEADLAVPTTAEIDRSAALLTDLTTYSEELLTKLILGQQSLDDWDTYIADLKRLGLDEIIEINQARYDRGHNK